MLEMAGVVTGASVLDLACGAGSQTIRAAQLVGPDGRVVANDIAETMLDYVHQNARAAGLKNVTTLLGAAEALDLSTERFDAAICRLGLMLFAEPAKALTAVWRALRPKAKLAAVVFSTPAANQFMAKPMQVLLRHAGRPAPAAGQPGIFALGGPGVIEQLFEDAGLVGIATRTVAVPLRMASAAQALALMQDAFGAYRAVLRASPEAVCSRAWDEVAQVLRTFETATGFVAPGEVLVAAGAKAE
jgi:SAM-dependent methyltransferase